MGEDTAGDPMSCRKWSRKSTYTLSDEMADRGIEICANSVGALLRDLDYSLKSNRKTIAETQHPDRNQQFEIISDERRRFEDKGQPIISVDSKKKELVGNFKNPGKTWSKLVTMVLNHDFRSQAVGIASPYGIYETTLNLGTVIVGVSHDTPEFAVESIDFWLQTIGWSRYPGMQELLILGDAGGSNGYRPRLWKYFLYQLISKVHGIKIKVCHYPSGASKWNPTDHRLFSFISKNWAGQPLKSYEIILNHIRKTKTKTGLKVDAFLNEKQYQKGKTIDDSKMKEIKLTRNKILPQWNYTISP